MTDIHFLNHFLIIIWYRYEKKNRGTQIVPISDLINNRNIDSTSELEQAGDLLLSPYRTLFKGKSFQVIKGEKNTICYAVARHKNHISPSLLAKLASLPLLILAPLGILLKLASYSRNIETRNVFSDFTKLGLHDNTTLFAKAQELDLLKEWFFTVTETPTNFLSKVIHTSETCENSFPLLMLKECACQNTREFDRFLTPRRQNIEKQICSNLAKQGIDPKKTYTFLSLGAGNLLQDWILIGKLAKLGIKKINYMAVEPKDNSAAIQKLQEFFPKIQGCEINIRSFKSMEKYTRTDDVQTRAPLDSVFAIDFDEISAYGSLSDLHAARNLLSDDGSLYACYGQDDLLVHKDGSIVFFAKKGKLNKYLRELNKLTFSSDTISIGAGQIDFMNLSLFHGVFTQLLFCLQSKGIKKVNITVEAEENPKRKTDLESFSSPGFEVSVEELASFGEKKFDILAGDSHCLSDPTASERAQSLLNEGGFRYLFEFPDCTIHKSC
jgi:hypothetical protein